MSFEASTEFLLRKLDFIRQMGKKNHKAFINGFEEACDLALEYSLSQKIENPFSELKNIGLQGAKSVFEAFLTYFKSVFDAFQEEKLKAFDYDLDKILEKYKQLFKMFLSLNELKNLESSEKEKVEAAENILKNNIIFIVCNDAERKELLRLKNDWNKALQEFVNGYEYGYKYGILNAVVFMQNQNELSGEVFLRENRLRVPDFDYAFLAGYDDALSVLKVYGEADFQKFNSALQYLKKILEDEFNDFFIDNSLDFESVEILRERYAVYIAFVKYLNSLQPENEVFYPDFFSDLVDGFFEDLTVCRENLIFFNDLIENNYLAALKNYSEGYDFAIERILFPKVTDNSFTGETRSFSEKLAAGANNSFLSKEIPDFLKESEGLSYNTIETAFSDEFLIYDSINVQLDFKDEINLTKTLFPEQPSGYIQSTEHLILPFQSLRNPEGKAEDKPENQKNIKESYFKKIIDLISPGKTLNRITKIFSSETKLQNSGESISGKEITQLPTLKTMTGSRQQRGAYFSDISAGIVFESSQDEIRPVIKEDKFLSYNISKFASGELLFSEEKNTDCPKLHLSQSFKN